MFSLWWRAWNEKSLHLLLGWTNWPGKQTWRHIKLYETWNRSCKTCFLSTLLLRMAFWDSSILALSAQQLLVQAAGFLCLWAFSEKRLDKNDTALTALSQTRNCVIPRAVVFFWRLGRKCSKSMYPGEILKPHLQSCSAATQFCNTSTSMDGQRRFIPPFTLCPAMRGVSHQVFCFAIRSLPHEE